MAIGTATHNLQGFIDEVLQVLRGLFDYAYTPDNPSINPGTFPYVTVYMANGTSKGEPAGLISKDLTDVVIVIVVPLEDYAKAVNFLLPYREQIPIALYKWFYVDDDGGSAHAQHIGTEINFTMGPIEWPQGQQMFGYLITLSDVKIENEVS